MIALLLICHDSTIALQWQHILNLLVSTHIHSSVHQLLYCYVVQAFAGHLSCGSDEITNCTWLPHDNLPWLQRLFQNVNCTPQEKVFWRSLVESCLDEKRSWNETLRHCLQCTNEWEDSATVCREVSTNWKRGSLREKERSSVDPKWIWQGNSSASNTE